MKFRGRYFPSHKSKRYVGRYLPQIIRFQQIIRFRPGRYFPQIIRFSGKYFQQIIRLGRYFPQINKV
jgi:hypothetical protein